MYDIICCIIFGFFVAIGIAEVLHFLVKSLFKFNSFKNQALTEDNIEYILRSAKYNHATYEPSDIPSKNSEEFNFIYENLN